MVIVWLLIGGCSEDEGLGPEVDKGWGFVTEVSILNVEEIRYVPGQVFKFSITAQCKYPGKGWVAVNGRNGGNDVGQMISPSEGVVGTTWFPVNISAGRLEVPIELRMTTESKYVGLDVHVSCDSLLVDGKMVHWESEEGRSVYWEDIPPDTMWIFNRSGQINTVYSEGEN